MKTVSQSVFTFGLGVFGIVLASQPGFAATELARVNAKVITLEDFNKQYHENSRLLQANIPTKKAALDEVINREVGIQEAKRQNLDKDPEVIERMNTVLYQALLEKKLTQSFESIHVTDDEAKEYYSKNPEIRTSHIFVALRPDASAADQKKAYERIKKIHDEQLKNEQTSFAEVAQHFSDGPSALMGGDIDYQTKDRLDPAYYNAATQLSKGKTSKIVRSQFGYHIIKLTAVRPWDETDKALVKRMVFEEQRAKIYEKFMAQLKSKSAIAMHTELLKQERSPSSEHEPKESE